MAELLPLLKAAFTDDEGELLVGGKIYTYVAGTTTPKATYVDGTEDTPNTNPVILDSSGKADIWLGSGYYKIIVKDADDNLIDTYDDISRPATGPEGDGFVNSVHEFTAGQSATDLTDESFNATSYSSVRFIFEIVRGTTIFATGEIVMQYLNSTWRVVEGGYTGEDHGLTWSVSQATTIGQLRVAANAGDDGTIKFKKALFTV